MKLHKSLLVFFVAICAVFVLQSTGVKYGKENGWRVITRGKLLKDG